MDKQESVRRSESSSKRKPSADLPGYLLILNWPVSIPGGVNEAVLGLAQDLQTRGYHPIIGVATWAKDPQPEMARGIEIVSLRLRDPYAEGSGVRLLPGFLRTLPSDIRSLVAFLRLRNIQVVNSYFPSLDVGIILLLKLLGVYQGKFIFTFQGADIRAIGKTQGLVRKIWQLLIRKADGIVACSEALSREVISVVPGAHVTTIHNGVDVRLFSRTRQPRSRLQRILHIGKFEYKKSQDVVLRAFRRLLEIDPDVSLVLIGATGPELDQTRTLISDLGLESKVELHVNVPHEQLPAFMETADIFVLPSRVEPFGIVLLEAGAAGLPVIATRVGGIPELIEHERTGLLISPDSVDELEAAIKRLMIDTSLAESLARNWQDKVLASWSWRATGQKYIALLQEMSST
jgi:glycosyltransferase involved in cell wall biosynthesis